MIDINSGKNYGDLYWFCADVPALSSVLIKQTIAMTNKDKTPEVNKKGQAIDFACLTRDKHLCLKNNKKWRYGVIIDGARLSDFYKITPFDFAGTQDNQQFRVAALYAYISAEPGQDKMLYKVSTRDFGTQVVTADIYAELYNLSTRLVRQRKATISEQNLDIAERPIKIDGESYYRTSLVKFGPHGAKVTFGMMSDKLRAWVSKRFTQNSEERIWKSVNQKPLRDPIQTGKGLSLYGVDISKCVKGLILPKEELRNARYDEAADAEGLDLLLTRLSMVGLVVATEDGFKGSGYILDTY